MTIVYPLQSPGEVSRQSRVIPRKALFLALVIAAAIVGLATALICYIRYSDLNTAVQAERDVVASVSHDFERNFQLYNLSLEAVVDALKTTGLLELPPDLLHKVLFDRSTEAEYLGSIYVLDSYGNVFLDSRNLIPERRDFATAAFFKHHREVKDDVMFIGHPFIPKGSHSPSITLSRRLELADGSFAGVVVGTMDIGYFRETLSRVLPGEDSGMSLILVDGTTLLRFPYDDKDVGVSVKGMNAFEQASRVDAGTFKTVTTADHLEKLFVSKHLVGVPLILIAARTTRSIEAVWRREALVIGVLTLFLLSSFSFLAIILLRELKRRESAESSLFRESQRLRVTLGSIGDAVVSTNLLGEIIYMNEVALAMTGWSQGDAYGYPSAKVLTLWTDEARPFDPIGDMLDRLGGATHCRDLMLCRKDGSITPVESKSATLLDETGGIIGAIVVLHDVSESRKIANRMAHLAQHDMLTDLPNRVLLSDRLTQAIDRGRRYTTKVAVLFVDLDHFKNINDSLGHAAGDQLLVTVARRLRECVRESDTVCRQGGDEFVVLITDHESARGPSVVAEKIMARLRTAVRLEGQDLNITASVGIALFPDDGTTAEELLRNADAAMYLAKHSERNSYRFFTAALGEQARRRLRFEKDIADGLLRDEFVLLYQPQFLGVNQELIGVEALVRWNKDGRVVGPNEFIAIAEECGQIHPLGDRILELACAQLRQWTLAGMGPFTVAVNISAHQLRNVGFPDRVKRIVTDAGADPRFLEFEITESAILDAGDRTRIACEAFRALGIGLALDDFGTGYSSLSNLKGFPITRLKIDQSFVRNIALNEGDRAIVRAVIHMAESFGLRTIAEGVETPEQLALLVELGCEEIQGYLLGRPVRAEEIAERLTCRLALG